MSDRQPEKRRFGRVLYQTPATLITLGGRRISCQVIDLSLRGCLLRLPRLIEAEEAPCNLLIPLAKGLIIEMTISPVHSRGLQQGFLCQRIDLASLSLLRRLIEMNLGDSEALERELNALIPEHV